MLLLQAVEWVDLADAPSPLDAPSFVSPANVTNFMQSVYTRLHSVPQTTVDCAVKVRKGAKCRLLAYATQEQRRCLLRIDFFRNLKSPGSIICAQYRRWGDVMLSMTVWSSISGEANPRSLPYEVPEDVKQEKGDVKQENPYLARFTGVLNGMRSELVEERETACSRLPALSDRFMESAIHVIHLMAAALSVVRRGEAEACRLLAFGFAHLCRAAPLGKCELVAPDLAECVQHFFDFPFNCEYRELWRQAFQILAQCEGQWVVRQLTRVREALNQFANEERFGLSVLARDLLTVLK